MTVKVSVIVAVFNPGSHIDELLASFDAQSLPPEEFEVLLCDDDSTDGTRERLSQWVAERPYARLIHNSPNSGWPGRPRNLGIDAARGEYVFFADNDDRLPPRSLSWMYDFAKEHDSDVVIPKLVGVGGRKVPRVLFKHNIVDAKLGKDDILAILTPHKLFRTAMVREHGIRFPEGKVRLEDHFFVVSAYFAAKRISVYADNVCYYWMRRADVGNASFRAGRARRLLRLRHPRARGGRGKHRSRFASRPALHALVQGQDAGPAARPLVAQPLSRRPGESRSAEDPAGVAAVRAW